MTRKRNLRLADQQLVEQLAQKLHRYIEIIHSCGVQLTRISNPIERQNLHEEISASSWVVNDEDDGDGDWEPETAQSEDYVAEMDRIIEDNPLISPRKCV